MPANEDVISENTHTHTLHITLNIIKIRHTNTGTRGIMSIMQIEYYNIINIFAMVNSFRLLWLINETAPGRLLCNFYGEGGMHAKKKNKFHVIMF